MHTSSSHRRLRAAQAALLSASVVTSACVTEVGLESGADLESASASALTEAASAEAGAAAALIDPGAPLVAEHIHDPSFVGDPGVMRAPSLDAEGAEGRAAVTAAAASAVTLYKDANYGGSSKSLAPGLYDVDALGIGNDQLSSLKVPAGLVAKIFQHEHYAGSSRRFTADYANLKNSSFNDTTSSIAVAGPITESTGSPYALAAFGDVEDLKYEVASDPTVIRRLAYLADMIGFAWCGGTGTPYVGNDFDVSRNSDGSYSMKAHYSSGDPYASGYRANERLKITLSNFRIAIDPSQFTYGTPLITDLTPVALDSGLAINNTDTESTIGVELTASHSDSYTHETNASLTTGISVSVTAEADVPFGSASATTEFSFSATSGWSSSSTRTSEIGSTWSYGAVVPPHSRKLVTMLGAQTKSDVTYTGRGYISFDIKLEGFLRWSGNGRIDHPTNRPTVAMTFGSGNVSGIADILDKWDHAHISGYSNLDWDWIKAYGRGSLGTVMGFLRRGIAVPLSGKFTGVTGMNVSFTESAPQALR